MYKCLTFKYPSFPLNNPPTVSVTFIHYINHTSIILFLFFFCFNSVQWYSNDKKQYFMHLSMSYSTSPIALNFSDLFLWSFVLYLSVYVLFWCNAKYVSIWPSSPIYPYRKDIIQHSKNSKFFWKRKKAKIQIFLLFLNKHPRNSSDNHLIGSEH